MESGTDPLLQWLSSAGSLGILAAAVVGFIRGWIVSGAAFNRVIEERNRAHDLIAEELRRIDRRLRRIETGDPFQKDDE